MKKDRKRRGKSTDTDLKAQEALEAVASNPIKSRQDVAEDLGIHRTTLGNRIKRALNDEEISEAVTTSKRRLIQMLSRCDAAFLRVLSWDAPENFGNQIKVAQSIYRSFGVLNDEAPPIVQSKEPVLIFVDGRKYEFHSPK